MLKSSYWCNWTGTTIALLHDPVTWCKISHPGTQVTQLGFQNRAIRTSVSWHSFALDVPLCNLRPIMADFVPRDWVVQRAYRKNQLLISSFPYMANGITYMANPNSKIWLKYVATGLKTIKVLTMPGYKPNISSFWELIHSFVWSVFSSLCLEKPPSMMSRYSIIEISHKWCLSLK